MAQGSDTAHIGKLIGEMTLTGKLGQLTMLRLGFVRPTARGISGRGRLEL